MAKPEWGTKRTCQSCGARFYDFGRSPAVCPACGAVFDVEALSRARRARAPVRAVAAASDEAVADDRVELDTNSEAEELEEETELEEEEETIEADESGDEEDEGLIEDASELGEDEDMSDVIEGEIDEEPR